VVFALEFTTENGYCSPNQQRAYTEASSIGYSYTIRPAGIFKRSGLSPLPTGAEIPSMTGLTCHRAEGTKVFVSSEKDPFYCGWLDKSTLLRSAGRSDSGLVDPAPYDEVCGKIAPLSLKDFCKRFDDKASQLPRACADERVKVSPFQTKFVVYSANQRANGGRVEQIDVPIYRSAAETADDFGKVRVFNVLFVFDVSEDGLRYLLGVSHRKMLGWIDADAGTVWYSKLAVFFSEASQGEVKREVPGSFQNVEIATKPDNLYEMIRGKEFRKYPVLLDKRRRDKNDPIRKRPYLEIAFIASICGDREHEQFCPDQGLTTSFDYSHINKADIVFLIDATHSMRDYFEMVSRAVRETSENYKNSPDYRFGVAVYGDYLSPEYTRYNDPIQYRIPVQLKVLTEGSEIDSIKNESLFVDDPLGDLPEAAIAAIYRTVKGMHWRENVPKFIIHIADHGDHSTMSLESGSSPASDIINEPVWQSIFYMPIAVRGDYQAPFNRAFVRLGEQIISGHTTDSGLPMGAGPKITYNSDKGTGATEDEYTAILGAMLGALDFGGWMREGVLEEIYDQPLEQRQAATRLSVYPPGYSRMTQAGIELFFGKVKDVSSLPVAAKGFIETAILGKQETNWDYFAALEPWDLGPLRQGFSTLCRGIDSSDGEIFLINALRDVVKILTGDTFRDNSAFSEYFTNRDTIPLSTQTMLGDGIIELINDLDNPSGGDRVDRYKTEVCRTATLLRLMDNRQRLLAPSPDEDLIWDPTAKTFSYKNHKEHDWVFRDDFGNEMIFLPLSYLPGPPDRVISR